MCVCVCVCETERRGGRGTDSSSSSITVMFNSVCMHILNECDTIEPERMGCECTGWAYHWWGAGEGINRWWGKKKMSLSTRRLSFSKESVGNVKHSGVFTHLPVIQIFRLRLGPAVRQIPANPRGVVWPNLPQSMWPRLESKGREKKGGKYASVSVCALHFKLPTLCANI